MHEKRLAGKWKARENVADTFLSRKRTSVQGKNKNQGKYSQTRMWMWRQSKRKVPQLFWGVSSAPHTFFNIYFDCIEIRNMTISPSLIAAVVVVVGLLQVCVSVSCNFVTQWSEVGVLWNGNGMKWNDVECNQTRNGKTRKKTLKRSLSFSRTENFSSAASQSLPK